MHTLALGSAAAMLALALSLTYCIWPSAHRVAAPGMETTVAAFGPITRPQAEPDAVPKRSSQEPEAYTTLYEIPGGRATIHWIEYLKFTRRVVPRARSDVVKR